MKNPGASASASVSVITIKKRIVHWVFHRFTINKGSNYLAAKSFYYTQFL